MISQFFSSEYLAMLILLADDFQQIVDRSSVQADQAGTLDLFNLGLVGGRIRNTV